MVKQSLALENVKQEGPLPPVLPSAKDYISIPPPKPGYQQRLTHWGKSGGSEGHKTRLSTAGASWCGRVSPHALALLCLPLQQLLILLCHRSIFPLTHLKRMLTTQHFHVQFLCSGTQPPSQQVSPRCLQDTCQLFWLPVPSAS